MEKSKSRRELQEKAKRLKRRREDLELPKQRDLKAVAIKYEIGKKRAPQIVAAGKGSIAERIISLAEENNIPFFEDPGLTDLLSKLDLEIDIPPELYTLVAEVLAFTYQLNKMLRRKRLSKE
ncbi:EscU/YscU/HrcU family type III secretion system export apparatus switch protein [Thermoproteota archaeon]